MGRFAPFRLLVFLLVIVVVYCLWPRHPSLSNFDPKNLGPRLALIWQDSQAGKFGGVFWQEYLRHDLDYKFPPVDAMQMAWNLVQARETLAKATKASEQEKAQAFLREYYLRMRGLLKADFNPEGAAVFHVTWLTEADPAAENAAVDAQAGLLAELYGGAKEKYLKAAKEMFVARGLAEKAADSLARTNARNASITACQALKAATMAETAPAEASAAAAATPASAP